MRAEKGAATVEFALFAMFLVLIIGGIVDIGRGLYTAIAINDAAQEGAIFAAFTDDVAGQPITVDDITARVIASTSNPDLTVDEVDVVCAEQPRARRSGSQITVEVSHTIDLITPFISDWFGGALTIERSATADRFFDDCPTT